MPDVCVLWFLHVDRHRRRSGRHLCDVPGLCHPIRQTCRLKYLVPCLNVGLICELVALVRAQIWRHSRWSLPSLSRGTDRRVVRHFDDTRVDDLLPGRRLKILDLTLWSRFSGLCGSTPAQRSEVRAHQMARKLRSAGFTPQKNPSRALIKWLSAGVADCRFNPAELSFLQVCRYLGVLPSGMAIFLHAFPLFFVSLFMAYCRPSILVTSLPSYFFI